MKQIGARAVRRIAAFAGVVGAALLAIPEPHVAVAVGVTAALMLRIAGGIVAGLAANLTDRSHPHGGLGAAARC
jgi:hypothetical protein